MASPRRFSQFSRNLTYAVVCRNSKSATLSAHSLSNPSSAWMSESAISLTSAIFVPDTPYSRDRIGKMSVYRTPLPELSQLIILGGASTAETSRSSRLWAATGTESQAASNTDARHRRRAPPPSLPHAILIMRHNQVGRADLWTSRRLRVLVIPSSLPEERSWAPKHGTRLCVLTPNHRYLITPNHRHPSIAPAALRGGAVPTVARSGKGERTRPIPTDAALESGLRQKSGRNRSDTRGMPTLLGQQEDCRDSRQTAVWLAGIAGAAPRALR